VTDGKELKDAFVFEFDASSDPVPFTEVIFVAKNLATGEEITRRTPNVAPKMALNWRLKDAPVGEYELTLIGRAGDQTVTGSPVKVKVIR